MADVSHTLLEAILVDIDGTLIDSNDAHTRAWMAALAAHGHEFPFDQIRPLIGMGGDKLLDELLGLAADRIWPRRSRPSAAPYSAPRSCMRSRPRRARENCCSGFGRMA